VLRQPLEDRRVSISRAKFTVDYPASFMLVASMNPCPCGYYNHPEKDCVCSPGVVQKYLSKISGPLLDRIDLHVEVTPVSFNELSSKVEVSNSESSNQIRDRVIKARELQEERFSKNKGVHSNAQMNAKQLREICVIDEKAQGLLKKAMEKLGLSARAYDRILKVSRTIADLDFSEQIKANHVAEAIQYRSLDREGWAG
jgi:magnesium chelatase family protein